MTFGEITVSIVEQESDKIEGMEGATVKDFLWTDKKSALPLKVVQECKTTKVPSGLDLETVRN